VKVENRRSERKGSWKPCKVKKRRMPPKQRKIAVMGSRSVGKSSLAIQFAQGQFVDRMIQQ